MVLERFFDTLFGNNCNCTQNECIVGPSAYNLPFSNTLQNNLIPKLCNVITYPPSETTTTDYTMSLDPQLSSYGNLASGLSLYNFFIKRKILNIENNSVYLYNGKPFTWENVQEIQDKDSIRVRSTPVFKYILEYFYKTKEFVSPESQFTNAIKLLFWYFRKSIVDGIIKDTIINFKLNILAVSVGSTNITSDYDITLYSPSSFHISFCIRVFSNTIQQLFLDKSSIVFDTNIYGSAFIQFTTQSEYAPSSPTKVQPQFIDNTEKSKLDQPFHTSVKCNNKKFYYIRSDDSFTHSQHTWALIKLLFQLDTQDTGVHGKDLIDDTDTIKGDVFKTLSKSLEGNLYFDTALLMYLFLKKSKLTIPYASIVNEIGKYTHQSSELYVSFVSLVNFFGHETYFTRGSFLDVVVNQQMCQTDIIPLTLSTYLDSFIENTADFIHSFKDKYSKRAQYAIDKLENKQFSKKFSDIITEFKSCKDTNCKVYIQQQLVLLIVETLDTFTTPPDNIPVFYTIIDSIYSLKTVTLDSPSSKLPVVIKPLLPIDESKSLQNSHFNTPRASIV
jgi:hypothetical protein